MEPLGILLVDLAIVSAAVVAFAFGLRARGRAGRAEGELGSALEALDIRLTRVSGNALHGVTDDGIRCETSVVLSGARIIPPGAVIARFSLPERDFVLCRPDEVERLFGPLPPPRGVTRDPSFDAALVLFNGSAAPAQYRDASDVPRGLADEATRRALVEHRVRELKVRDGLAELTIDDQEEMGIAVAVLLARKLRDPRTHVAAPPRTVERLARRGDHTLVGVIVATMILIPMWTWAAIGLSRDAVLTLGGGHHVCGDALYVSGIGCYPRVDFSRPFPATLDVLYGSIFAIFIVVPVLIVLLVWPAILARQRKTYAAAAEYVRALS